MLLSIPQPEISHKIAARILPCHAPDRAILVQLHIHGHRGALDNEVRWQVALDWQGIYFGFRPRCRPNSSIGQRLD